MKKVELLIPVGDSDSLDAAILNGADAVYLGGYNFGARKFAKNFSNEELVLAIKKCHLYGVKIYVVMNTLVKNNEVNSFIDQVRFLYKSGVDAIIVQDFGMICLIREMFPKLDVHVSTQANTCNRESLLLYKDMGISRVVLARELSVEEIKSFSDIDIELEVFIHGAICVSYSGNCLMSSMIGGRSGNRGECAGSCRLIYELYNKDSLIDSGYLLSTKEMNVSSKINELINTGISSFKVEGRMKSSLYVGYITKLYRRLIDDFDSVNLDEETLKLKSIYNRGFTLGNLYKDEIINKDFCNHIGLEIGEVVSVNKKKICIKLNHKLCQGDGIRFLNSGEGFVVNYLYDKDDNLIRESDSICYLDNTINLDYLDKVMLTYDSNLYKELSSDRKVLVSYKVKARVGNLLEISLSDGDNTVSVTGKMVDVSTNVGISEDIIFSKLNKLGNSIYKVFDIDYDIDNNIFINMSELNSIRRELVDKLNYLRENRVVDYEEKVVSFEKINLDKCVGRSSFVYNEEQLNIVKDYSFDRIYTVCNSEMVNVLSKCYFEKNNEFTEILVNEVGKYNKSCVYGDYFLNVYNIYTAYYLYKFGYKSVCLSVELSYDEIKLFIDEFIEVFGFVPAIEIVGYGKCINMIIKGNILGLNTNVFTYKLVDKRNREFNVYYDGVNTYVMNYENINIDVDNLLDKVMIRYSFYNEEVVDVDNILKKIRY